ncbi:uncharacterized protein ACRADG_007089 [Cochliomyia hominivorax]
MFSLKSILLLATCLVLTVSTSPITYENFYEPVDSIAEVYEYQPILVRHARSPQGNIDFNLKEDQFGRQGSVTYNQNLFKSSDGRGSIDAYAQGVRNFDYNHNAFNGGIRGSYSF